MFWPCLWQGNHSSQSGDAETGKGKVVYNIAYMYQNKMQEVDNMILDSIDISKKVLIYNKAYLFLIQSYVRFGTSTCAGINLFISLAFNFAPVKSNDVSLSHHSPSSWSRSSSMFSFCS